MEYRCTIEIDLTATSPLKAAKRAYELLWAKDAARPMVDVRKLTHAMIKDAPLPKGVTRVDLDGINMGEDPVVTALHRFIRAYYNPEGSMDFSVMDEVWAEALKALGVTIAELDAERAATEEGGAE